MEMPQTNEYHANYQKYFDLVPSGAFLEMLQQNAVEAGRFFESVAPNRQDFRYAEGKWTVKEILMHIIDTERVFAYRALAAARSDTSPVYRMDEELYAANVDVSSRTMSNLVAEFLIVREATRCLFENMTDEQSKRWSNVVTHPMSARAIGYFLIGHVFHHVAVVRERYDLSDVTG